jgi:CubicO group peptidase (beta-lactamase class C family)
VLPLRDFLVRAMPARIYLPGHYSAYSDYGIALAAYIVQQVSGEPYERYITNHILALLGMTHSAATQPLPPDIAPLMSKGYKHGNSAYQARDFEWIAAPAAPSSRSACARTRNAKITSVAPTTRLIQ